MIVTKARDHGLVQLTRDLSEWLMTSPRHGRPYGVKVHVDGKLEKSKRFDSDGLYKDHPIIGEKKLLQYWTPETCVFADSFDIVITVDLLYLMRLILAWRRWYSSVHLLAFSADCSACHLVQFGISRIFNKLQIRKYACRSRPMFKRGIQSKHANEIHLHRLPIRKTQHRGP
jgi:hypothetical protein